MILKTLTASIILLLISCSAQARNDYFNQYWQQCRQGEVRTYGSYQQDGNSNNNYNYNPDYNSNSYNNSDGNRQEIGASITWYLGSNCTDETQEFMFNRMKIQQQLELAKMCQRYKHKQLPDNFAELRSECAGFPDDIEVEHRPPEGSGSYYDELIQEIKDGKHPDKNPKKYHSEDLKVPFQDSLKTKTLKIPKGLDKPDTNNRYGIPSNK